MPPKSPTVGRISGRHSSGTPNSRHSSSSQAAGGEVHQRGARGGGDVGGEGAGQPVEEPGVGGAEPQPPAPRRLDLGQDPGELGGREVGVERQAGALQRQGLGALRAQPLDRLAGAVVLPDDDRRERLAGGAVPGEAALALIVEARAPPPARPPRRRPGRWPAAPAGRARPSRAADGAGGGGRRGGSRPRRPRPPAARVLVVPWSMAAMRIRRSRRLRLSARASPTARSAARISACRLAIMSPIGGPWNRFRSKPNQITSSRIEQPDRVVDQDVERRLDAGIDHEHDADQRRGPRSASTRCPRRNGPNSVQVLPSATRPAAIGMA